MRQVLMAMVIFAALVLRLIPQTADKVVSESTEACIECHAGFNPGIVENWRQSRHARVTPGEGMAVKGPASRFSAGQVPDNLKNSVVGCAECHTLRPGEHRDSFEHNGYTIHLVVTPGDCAVCHPQEQNQFSENLMSHAHGNLVDNPVYRLLVQAINQTAVLDQGKLTGRPPDALTEAESCLYCHGTRLEVRGTAQRETDFGEMAFPVIRGWPNQGVGRMNPDGTRGTCSACHTRHRFSLEMARKPATCSECHEGPDVPAHKVYTASKHGNIYAAMNRAWNFENVPWKAGEDFQAPTCAACHISLVTTADGQLVSERTHRMNDRLPWRIFGLIYAHPHPRNPDTSIIRNHQGLALPTDFDGNTAGGYLIDRPEQEARQGAMQKLCLNCHGTSWVQGHWARFENTIRTSNDNLLAATRLMQAIWQSGFARFGPEGDSPFDEAVEREWMDTWLIYANTIRFASAMAGGGDFGVFAEGRYRLSQAIARLADWLVVRKKYPVAADSE